MNKAVELKKNIFWCGALDYDIKTFDIVMATDYGTTYNAYVVKGAAKTALIEVSKDRFFDEFASRVKSISFNDLDYIVLNHTEPDHSGALGKLLELYPNATVVGSKTAVRFLKKIVNKSFKSLTVEEGDTLDLGGMTLKFISAPFLHWPDSMFTYLEEEKVLFSCDFLGCHYCTDKVTNDKIDDLSYGQSFKYYFDVIMSPFKPYVLQALDKIDKLEVDMVCTGHGAVLVTEIEKYKELYRIWSTKPPRSKTPLVSVVFVSAYGYTEEIAREIAKGISDVAVNAELINLVEHDVSEVIEKIQQSQGFLIGSPTINGDTLPPVWELLSELNPIVYKGVFAGAFGSFGWSGEAPANIEARLKQLKLNIPAPPLKINFKANEDELKQAFEYGREFAIIVKNAEKA